MKDFNKRPTHIMRQAVKKKKDKRTKRNLRTRNASNPPRTQEAIDNFHKNGGKLVGEK